MSIKIIVNSQELKDKLLKESEYIHDLEYIECDKANTLMHIYMNPDMIEVKTKNLKAYKLIRKMKDGSLSPLFINQKSRIPMGVWMDAEFHSKKGFAERKGWHCTLEKNAPHLSEKGRVWVEVEVEDYEFYNRPESQGGTWVLAQKMKVVKEL